MLVFNKIKHFGIVLSFILGVAFVSCKSNYTLFTIENMRSAPDELSQDIQSITLMNRSMNDQFQKFNEDSLQMYFYRNGFQLSKIILDSTACDTTLRALAGLMFESGRYDVVIPIDRNLKRSISYELLPDTLNNNQVSEICSNFNTDALLVLERFSTKTMADVSEEKYRDNYGRYQKSYNATLDLKYDAFFRFYKPGKKSFLKEISISDTIYWESTDNRLDRLFSKLPTVKQAIINGGIKAALDLDSKISPIWVPEKRGYFLFKSQGDLGEKYMKENNLEKAGQYWSEMSNSSNKKNRSKAEYNLALINELNGNVDKAIEYGLRSYHSFYRFQTETYLKKLQSRKETLKKTH